MADVRIRPVNELDIEAICRIDERITGKYRPDVWEDRVVYFIRRDPDSSQVAEVDGKVVGFMLGEVRGGEFGMEEPTGWLEFFGVDPSARERGIGRGLTDALLAGYRPAPTGFFTAVMTLELRGDATMCRAVAMHRNVADRDLHADMGFHDGWGTVLDQLGAYAPTM